MCGGATGASGAQCVSPAVRNNAALEIKLHQRCQSPELSRNFNPRRCQMSPRPSRNGTRVLKRARTLIRGGSWWKPSMNIKCKLRIFHQNKNIYIWRSLDQSWLKVSGCFFFITNNTYMASDALQLHKVANYFPSQRQIIDSFVRYAVFLHCSI